MCYWQCAGFRRSALPPACAGNAAPLHRVGPPVMQAALLNIVYRFSPLSVRPSHRAVGDTRSCHRVPALRESGCTTHRPWAVTRRVERGFTWNCSLTANQAGRRQVGTGAIVHLTGADLPLTGSVPLLRRSGRAQLVKLLAARL
jgi:hypothetical protein